MDSIILQQPGQLRLIQRENPSAPPPGHALLRIHRVGICGTDWHAYHGRQPFFTYPRILGHELGVEIVDVNDPNSPLRPGQRCAVEPYLNCGQCIACRRGKINCCANLQVLGVHRDGGMQQWLIAPTDKLHPSDKLSFEQLALVETLGIGCHGAARAQVQPGENVLVLGAGPIGMSILPFLRADGGKIIVADVSPPRLEFCRQWGSVEHALDARGDLLAELMRLTSGDLPTSVFDATGNPQSMHRAFDFVAPGGRLVFVGLFQGDVSFNDPAFHRREMTLMGSRNALPADFRRIIRMIEQGEIDTRPWITHQTDYQKLIQALPGWLSPEARVIKAMVAFD